MRRIKDMAPRNPWAFELFDDFLYYTDADLWTKEDEANGTVTHEGPGRSRAKLAGGTADNDAAVLATTNELFKLIANQAIVGECLLEWQEGNTDDCNVGFGFADAMAESLLADDAATEPAIANEGALIYKLDGGTVWKFATEMDTVQTVSTSTKTSSSTEPQLLRIEIMPIDAKNFEAKPFVNGIQLIDSTSKLPICHTLTLGTATDMDFGVELKCGSATAEALYVDYLYAAQVRENYLQTAYYGANN